jgi:hypothetical protein
MFPASRSLIGTVSAWYNTFFRIIPEGLEYRKPALHLPYTSCKESGGRGLKRGIMEFARSTAVPGSFLIETKCPKIEV